MLSRPLFDDCEDRGPDEDNVFLLDRSMNPSLAEYGAWRDGYTYLVLLHRKACREE